MKPGEIQTLFSRPARPSSSILSVYLDVDQSRSANRNRGFETQLKDMMTPLRNSIRDLGELAMFSRASKDIGWFVSLYQPKAGVLAMFFDQTDGAFWHIELNVPMQSQARWDRELFLQPLANALDQFERYGVAMVDRSHMRLFTVFLGQIEEQIRTEFSPERVRHIKTVGTDHIGSASHVQRKADKQIQLNLKRVSRELESLVQTKGVNRLILAGTPEVTSELRNLLSKSLASRIIGTMVMAIEASDSHVLAATRAIVEDYERVTELRKVNDVMTAAAKNDKAVVGLGHTLNAVNSNRVWELIYSQDFRAPGFECSNCEALSSIEKSTCPNCGAMIRRVDDIVERAVEHALRNGARIETVTAEASASLDAAGGIGAFLKARTGTVQM